jgi:hypothetical protein
MIKLMYLFINRYNKQFKKLNRIFNNLIIKGDIV